MVIVAKKVTSVSIDEDLRQRLDESEHINASGLFNSFLREYFSTGSADGLDFHIRQVESELADARDKVKRLEAKREELLNQKQKRESEVQEELEARLDRLSSINRDMLGPENPAITKHANELGMQPTQLVEEVRSYSG